MNARVLFLTVVGVLAVQGLVLASDAAVKTSVSAQQAVSVNVDNKVCPVMGGVIASDRLGQATVEYKGKVYNLCCPMCKDTFLADPEKYSKIAENEASTPDFK